MALEVPANCLSPLSDPTRERLLEAAGEVFAEKGFRGATVREICQRANANVAAVNYHFGSKEQLYHAAIGYWVEIAAERNPLEPGEDASPEARLEHFVWAMLRRILDEGKPAWHGRLMFREMSEPTSYTDEHLRRYVAPMLQVLREILCDWPGRALPDAEIQLETMSIMGQILFPMRVREVGPRLNALRLNPCGTEATPEGKPITVEMLARHITAFTSAALTARRN